MKKFITGLICFFICTNAYCWGFYGHQKINYLSVFLLPPEMISFYKIHIDFISAHAVDPDKRRYAIKEEGPRHYIDIDRYGSFPYPALPRKYDSAVACYSEDTIQTHGIVPWWVQIMQARLTKAFKTKDAAKILKLSAEIGHYISDAHVPLHASHNHNGQYTGQHGIHGFWESRVPELLAENSFSFWIGKADYLYRPDHFIWDRVLESAAAADTVLKTEKALSMIFPADQKYAFEDRNGIIIRQYASAYTIRYNDLLNGMVERRMRQSIYAVASFWYTAWVDAGQPDLKKMESVLLSEKEKKEMEELNRLWREGNMRGRSCD
jgi:hypothetical protein